VASTAQVPHQYLDRRGGYPERLLWLILVGRFLDEVEQAVDRWAASGANRVVPYDWPRRLRGLDHRYEPSVVVIVLGTNDALFVDAGERYPPNIDRLVATTGAPRVYWAVCSQRTAVAGRDRGCGVIEAALFDAKNRWRHLDVLPYDDVVAADPRHYGPDSIHLSQWGQDQFASLIAGYVGPER
jgi:lysophospholipase L1-like esterase